MTRRTPIEDRVYAPIEQIIDDHDPDRQICRFYSAGIVYADGTTLGPLTCRAGVAYVDVAVDLGEWVKALPCLHLAPPCPRREWGKRRCERRGDGDR